MNNHIKIGIIQNEPITADLSRNLRQIVQGYRECLDHGANLIIAPSHALCGAGLQDLADRTSFLQQTESALEVLAQELGSTPLILAAYAPMPGFLMPGNTDGDDIADEPEWWYDNPTNGILVPYILEHDTVTELENADIVDINGLQVYVDVNEEEVVIDDMEPDIIVHLPSTSWHAKAAEGDEERHSWEANVNGVPVVTVHPVATADGSLYGGGSAIYCPGGRTLARLPFFEAAARVINLSAKPTAKALPMDEEVISLALERGIRDSVYQNGYIGVCIPMDEPHSNLLATLCAEALGASNVHGISFKGNTTGAEVLKIKIKTLNEINLSADLLNELGGTVSDILSSRISNTILTTYADRFGLMPLCAITRHDLMMNNFVLFGNAGGYLAPLGNLYEIDAYLLSKYFSEKYDGLFGTLKTPERPEQDRIIHELADNNISAGALLHDHVCPFSEDDVRMVQRRIIASAQKRTQVPMVLHIDSEKERKNLPAHHRLND